MELAIIYIIIYLVEAFILWHYCINMFYPKANRLTEWLCIIPLYIILLLTSSQNYSYLNLFTFLLGNFLYIFILFYSKWYVAFFHSAIATCVMSLSEVLIANLIPNLVYNFFGENVWLKKAVILAVFSKLLYFLLMQSIIHIWGATKERLLNTGKSTGLLLLIPFFSIWIVITLMTLCISIILSRFLQLLIAISALLLLIINFLVFSIYRYNQQKEAEYVAMRLQLQKEYDTAEYYKLLLEEDEAKSILIHDIKKHLNSIALLNEQGEPGKIDAYIGNLISSSSLQTSVRICDNDLLNAILCRYVRSATEKGIPLRTDIRSECLTFMSDDDLTTMFCNLLDNAMDAVLLAGEGYIELSIAAKENTPFTILTMINTCRVNPFDAQGKLPTTKRNKLHHGYGMKSIVRIAGKYGGDMKSYYDEESRTFHTIIMIKNL